jgi:hypothetical protein
MYKQLYTSCLIILTSLGYSQSVTLTPGDYNQITITGNGGGTGPIEGRYFAGPYERDALLGTISNHPLTLFTNQQWALRINPGSDMGLGRYLSSTTWDGNLNSPNNLILSRLHSYGVGSKEFSGPSYAPFKTSVLGQAVTNASNFNRAGLLGVTDGQAGSIFYNIGVASFATTNPEATANTYNFWGYNRITSNVDAYGIRNDVLSLGSGKNYGAYNSIATTGTSNLYGTYNNVFSNNTITTNESVGTYNNLLGNRRLTGMHNKIFKDGSDIPNVYGINTEIDIFTTAHTIYGGRFTISNPSGSYGLSYGLYSNVINNSSYASYGIFASSTGTGTGLKYGIYAVGSHYAGYFAGNVHVSGTLSKSAGTFKIDHPQDPENKYLIHSFVESPDMMNVYNGNVTTDANGDATVELPTYFESLNKDFRYQLTTIGQKANAWVSEEVSGNTFKISTDKSNVKVSWQVTGIRNDPYANQNRIVAEVDKTEDEKGKYLNPQVYGKANNLEINSSHAINRIEKTTIKMDEVNNDKQDLTIREVVSPTEESLPKSKVIKP